MARIDRSEGPAASSAARPPASAAAAPARAGRRHMLGLREVFDPPTRVVIEEVDPWTGGGGNGRVRLHWDDDRRAPWPRCGTQIAARPGPVVATP